MEPLDSGDPQQVDRFRLVGRLGSGAMGRVFLGRAPDGAAVAVKTVHPHLLVGDQSEFRRRFVREVQAARRVGSAFTAAVVAADPHAKVPWLATEFVPGISLGAAVERFGPLPEASLRELAAGLFAALAEIHAVDLVHRDVKPSNIVLGVDGPRVIDFGIALPAGATGLTGTGHTVGTLGFMSPEQFERSDVGPESDVFSAGAVLAWAATGRPPFPGDTLPVLFASLTTRAPDLDGLPASLAPLVEAALAKGPAARPTARAARAMVPAPPTHVGADHGWLPRGVTHAILLAASAVLRAPAPPLASDGDTATAVPPPSATPKHPAPSAAEPPQQARTTPEPARTEPQAPEDRTFPEDTFDISWTGREPITDYATPRYDLAKDMRSVLIFLAIALPFALGLISHWDAMPDDGKGGKNFDTLGGVLGWCAAMAALGGLLALGELVLDVFRKVYADERHRLGVPNRVPWSLRIDPHGITTADNDAHRSVPWTQVKKVRITRIAGGGPYTYAGLHVYAVKGAKVTRVRPAGWFYPDRTGLDGASEVPVCVLGPLTDHQYVALTRALTRHAGAWEQSLSYTGNPTPRATRS
ncbi:protein kinase (plasmid) [Embleya sp. NBC_00888]|uniref:protein kinase domain-containing protein n=1 Tax=Embleya sp. NBC_00888 TaxID=2975960 RepID=UPI002F908CD3|nr:protein kinase [Embleya sp. NBC_00888]